MALVKFLSRIYTTKVFGTILEYCAQHEMMNYDNGDIKRDPARPPRQLPEPERQVMLGLLI